MTRGCCWCMQVVLPVAQPSLSQDPSFSETKPVPTAGSNTQTEHKTTPKAAKGRQLTGVSKGAADHGPRGEVGVAATEAEGTRCVALLVPPQLQYLAACRLDALALRRAVWPVILRKGVHQAGDAAIWALHVQA